MKNTGLVWQKAVNENINRYSHKAGLKKKKWYALWECVVGEHQKNLNDEIFLPVDASILFIFGNKNNCPDIFIYIFTIM